MTLRMAPRLQRLRLAELMTIGDFEAREDEKLLGPARPQQSRIPKRRRIDCGHSAGRSSADWTDFPPLGHPRELLGLRAGPPRPRSLTLSQLGAPPSTFATSHKGNVDGGLPPLCSRGRPRLPAT